MPNETDKTRARTILESVLRFLAVAVLKKYHPQVIGITGSVGKSSAREAITLVLGSQFAVRASQENYNNEIGIPLTVLGVQSGKRSLFKWASIFWRGLLLLIWPVKYPEVLVLEMGIDRPGDMEYLMNFVPVTVGVFLNVSSAHLEFFDTVENIAKEKGKLVTLLPKNGIAILNANEPLVMSSREKIRAKVLTFGREASANVSANHIAFSGEAQGDGYRFKLHYDGTTIPIRLPHIIAAHHIETALAAAAVGIAFKMNLVDIARALEKFSMLPGRLRVLEGVRDSVILDGSYNASPHSVEAGLQMLGTLKAVRRIALLGDMLELGDETEVAHRSVAHSLQRERIDLAFLVGRRMSLAAKELERLGFPGRQYQWFDRPEVVGEILQKSLRSGDVVLVKGSQSMRLEKAVELAMADSGQASKLLCRQSQEWRAKPFVIP